MATMEFTQRGIGVDEPGVQGEYSRSTPLTVEQLEDIEISRQQFAAGLGIPHEEVMKEFDALYPDDEEQ